MIDVDRIPLHSIIPGGLFKNRHLSGTLRQWTALASELENLGHYPSRIYSTEDVYLGIGFMDMKFQHVFIFTNYNEGKLLVKVAHFKTEDDSVIGAIILDNT